MVFTEEQVKAVPGKEMKEAFVAFNAYFTEKEKEVLVFEGLEKAAALVLITDAIEKMIMENEAGNLPDVVIDFYNKHIATEDPETPETTEAPPETVPETKKKSQKAPKEPKAPKPPKAPKEPKPVRVSKETLATNMLREGKTDEDIWNYIYAMYPSSTEEEKAFAKKRADKYLSLGQLHFSKESPEYKAKLEAIRTEVKAVLQKVVDDKKAEKEKGKAETSEKKETAPKEPKKDVKKTTTVKKPTKKG